MTLSATTRRAGPFSGNDSTTSFPFTFKVLDEADLDVYLLVEDAAVETLLTLGTHYSVTLNADQETSPGGSITYPLTGDPLATGDLLSVVSAIDLDQPLDLPSGGNFSPIALENELDRQVMQIQQLDERMERAIMLPAVDDIDGQATLPPASVRAGQLLGFDDDGNPALFTAAEGGTPYAMTRVAATATAGQTVFSTGAVYQVGYVDVYMDGLKLKQDVDYTASGGTSITLTTPANEGAELEILCYYGIASLTGWDATADLVQYTPAGTGAEDRSVENRLREVVSVQDFGADPTGVLDSGAAINLATAHLRSLIDAGKSACLVFPPGNYLTSISLDFTDLRADGGDSSWVVMGYGAKITATCTDRPVMDFMQSQWGTVAGIHIYGDETDMPRSGIQLARGFLKVNGRPQTASHINLTDVRTTGYFAWAGFYNYASEVCHLNNCSFINDLDDALADEGTIVAPSEVFDCAYAAIFDADNAWGCDSDYYTQTIPSPTSTSMILQTATNTSFMRPNGGCSIFLSSGQAQIKFTSCYAACLDGDAVVVYVARFTTNPASWRQPYNWDFELHAESDADESNSFRNMFRFIPEDTNSGSAINVHIRGLKWTDHNNHCDECVFRISDLFPAGSLFKISDCDIGIRKFRGVQSEEDTDGGPPSNGIFYPSNYPTTAGWAVSGRLAVPSSASSMPIGLLRFSGEYLPASLTGTYTPYPLGTYAILSNEINRQRYKGDFEFLGADTSEYTGATLDLAPTLKVYNGRIENESGALNLPILSADPSASNGLIYYNNVSKKVRVCEDSTWRDA